MMKSKPRMVEVTDPIECMDLLAHRNDLDAPTIRDTHIEGRIWAEADELRAWRASQADTGAKE